MTVSTAPFLDPAVCSLKATLAREREHIAAAHHAGATGPDASAALRDLTDRTIATAYRDLLEGTRPGDRAEIESQLALVAVGGYGRGNLAPYSDIDLLLLTSERPGPAVRPFVSRILRDLWDIGLELSHGVRSPSECMSLAAQDLPARTAILETRLLAGATSLYAKLQSLVRRPLSPTSVAAFVNACLADRAKEYHDYYAPTVCLLEPNVKKSPGSLRDLHLLRWIALARYGTTDLQVLCSRGVLSAGDVARLTEVSGFLCRLRNELHYSAGSAQDVLTREEQVRLAGWLGFEDQSPLLAVERFMQHYYRQTAAVHDIVTRFINRSRTRSRLHGFVNRLTTRRIKNYFLANRSQIAIDPAASPEVLTDAPRLLDFFNLARLRGLTIAADDLERIRATVGACAIDAAARRRFFEILAEPRHLGDLLRALHRVGLLGRLLPDFEHTRCLIQFNLEHKYTIDEHSIRAVESATAHLKRSGPVGDAYRNIRRKDLLHLALLCHDLGKGLDGDHSETGARIAAQTADLFGLSRHDRDLLVFLVHRHLLMAQVAFRRDIRDEATLVQFAREVAKPESLRLLYVLTAADTDAVAPGNWTAWKESLLTELYVATMEELAGEAPLSESGPKTQDLRRELFDALHIRFPMRWLEAQLEAMPVSYLRSTDPERMTAHLKILRTLSPGHVHVDHEYLPTTGLTRLTVITSEHIIPGIFSKIAGVLAAARIDVITAQIVTRPDGLLIDTFEGIDADYTGRPPASRSDELAANIKDVLLDRRTVESLFTQRLLPTRKSPAVRQALPRVEIDNDSSNRFTIVEVFAEDRLGLLYDLTRTLFELGLSVYSARISTHLDQVVDAFYVTTQDGSRLPDDSAQDLVRTRLLAVLSPS